MITFYGSKQVILNKLKRTKYALYMKQKRNLLIVINSEKKDSLGT